MDGSAAGVPVELSARLSEQLALVALGTARDGGALNDDLATLTATLAEAVSGYAGLRLRLAHAGHPVDVTALVPVGAEVVTSLRVALPPVSSPFAEGGRLTVWSTVPGSLVDLAADLGHLFAVRTDARDGNRADAVQLDRDLPAPGTSGVDGLDELATIHRAAGLLIAEGHDPELVLERLRVDAASHGTSTHGWAARLLGGAGGAPLRRTPGR